MSFEILTNSNIVIMEFMMEWLKKIAADYSIEFIQKNFWARKLISVIISYILCQISLQKSSHQQDSLNHIKLLN